MGVDESLKSSLWRRIASDLHRGVVPGHLLHGWRKKLIFGGQRGRPSCCYIVDSAANRSSQVFVLCRSTECLLDAASGV